MSSVETVKIKRPGTPLGYAIINKADMKPEHEEFTGEDLAQIVPSAVVILKSEASLNARIVEMLITMKLRITEDQWRKMGEADRVPHLESAIEEVSRGFRPTGIDGDGPDIEGGSVPQQVTKRHHAVKQPGQKGKWMVQDLSDRDVAGPYDTKAEADAEGERLDRIP